jgi:hypothetical protein
MSWLSREADMTLQSKKGKEEKQKSTHVSQQLKSRTKSDIAVLSSQR